MNNPQELPIHEMHKRHEGLTKAVAASYTEAACVCLGRHHVSPEDIQILASGEEATARATWKDVSDRAQNAWNNEIDATEAGAYACALAALELSQDLVAVCRAETRTGADYYVAPSGQVPEDLEECLRFEVSGVDAGQIRDIEYRLAQKLRQAAAGESNLPAVAGVVGFKASTILLASLEAQ